MLARVRSEALSGLQGHPVVVEADVVAAAPAFSVVGLPDAAVQESRERVRAAIVNSSYAFPSRRITVNLAPANLRKEGPSFDLPIALAFLLATGQVRDGSDGRGPLAAVGELGLDGSLRPVAGALAVAQSLHGRGVRGVVLPAGNAAEAALVPGLEVYPASSLAEAVTQLETGGRGAAPPADLDGLLAAAPPGDADFSDIVGQDGVKRALEIAVAGAHNVLMTGPPGAGKTMLARADCRPSCRRSPATRRSRSRASTAWRVCCRRASRSWCGGRSGRRTTPSPRPGSSAAAARHGRARSASLTSACSFSTSSPSIRLSALEGLRQPLEDGEVTISRRLTSVTYPARLMLVAAMNPCPCGFAGDTERECVCPGYRLHQYRSRLSGPLLDRIDLRLDVPRVPPRDRRERRPCDSSATIRARVLAARRRQVERLAGTGIYANAHMSARHLRRYCRMERAATAKLEKAYDTMRLSARAADRVVKVARTIADLDGVDVISAAHLGESLSYRDRGGERGW